MQKPVSEIPMTCAKISERQRLENPRMLVRGLAWYMQLQEQETLSQI